jgi:hypothetical protein
MEFVRTDIDQNLLAQCEYANPSSLPPNDIAGFFMEASVDGIELQIMRYRARLPGGLLDVRRSSSGGTIVRSGLPRCDDSIN